MLCMFSTDGTWVTTHIYLFCIRMIFLNLMIQIWQYLLGIMHRQKFKFFHKWHILLPSKFTPAFYYHHRWFLIYNHLQQYYAQYLPLFYFCQILIKVHVMTTQMNIVMIILKVSYFWYMKVDIIWILFYLLMCHFEQKLSVV